MFACKLYLIRIYSSFRKLFKNIKFIIIYFFIMSLPDFEKNGKSENYSKILRIIKTKEKEYANRIPKSLLEDKLKLLEDILIEIDDFKNILPIHFKKIRKIVVQKGGLLTNTFRREIYKKLFFLNNDQIDFYHYRQNEFIKNHIEIKVFYNKLNTIDSYQIQNEDIPNKRTSKKDEHIIEVDVKRTIANSYFEECHEELRILKRKLTNLLKLFFNLNPQYGYYQGFHDIALYVFLIFYNSEHLAIQMLQRIVEFYLKDYMVEIDNDGENSTN